ncbi:MAG: ABC transporter permease [Clostridiales bacterium]|nr:ABC transporter permease [Clostridiales bacterium]
MDNENKKTNTTSTETEYSLNDDRRVKVLSPGALVAKRFFRNRLAVTGMVILVIMFLFSFVGGLVSPYKQDEKFYRTEIQTKDYAGILYNTEYRYYSTDQKLFGSAAQAKALLAVSKGETSFKYNDAEYTIKPLSDEVFEIYAGGVIVGIGTLDVVSSSTSNESFSFEFIRSALEASTAGETAFTAEGAQYTLDSEGLIFADGEERAYVSRYIVRAVMGDVFLTRDFKNKLIDAVEAGDETFVYSAVNDEGETVDAEYILTYDAAKSQWNVRQEIDTTVFDTYAKPSWEHWLGTDRNGMDMLTRLMYGGRVSLIIGFIVVFIETILGVIFGGISGYFGGRVDNLIMRIVDIFYCIPSMPIIIIIGAAMDAANMAPRTRMLALMLILGFLGWPGIARLVRGQILSLREEEFMTATEATGLKVSRRIFKHLIPNVIPQLIVTMTMGLGGTIITEATLSFLGLGVRFPFASWGNIINDVNNTFVLTHYWNIWIPAGILLLLTVLAFNIVGDGLRDAFDPKMKR